jgi:hypothetical protein
MPVPRYQAKVEFAIPDMGLTGFVLPIRTVHPAAASAYQPNPLDGSLACSCCNVTWIGDPSCWCCGAPGWPMQPWPSEPAPAPEPRTQQIWPED